jgi:HK97 family phage prohead protease
MRDGSGFFFGETMEKMVVPFILEKNGIEETDKNFSFKGHAATFGANTHPNMFGQTDRIHKGAFVNSINEHTKEKKNFPVLWQHDTDMPLGIYKEIKEDKIGLFVHGILPKTDTFVSGRVIPQMRIGSIQKMSIGFDPVDFSFETKEEKTFRDLSKIDLWEASLVTFARDEDSKVLEVNAIRIENLKNMDVRELEGFLKTGASFSTTDSKTIISSLKAAGYRDGNQNSDRDGEQWAEIIREIKSINK